MHFSGFQGPTCSKQHFFLPTSFPKEGTKPRDAQVSPLQHWRHRMVQGDVGDPTASAICLDTLFSSSPLGKPHLSSPGHVSASLRYSWQLSYKLLLILSMVMKLRMIIANCHFRHYAVNLTLLSKLPSWESSQRYCRNQCDPVTFMFSLVLFVSPLLITEVLLTAETFYITNAL